jgi:hypothetical protein
LREISRLFKFFAIAADPPQDPFDPSHASPTSLLEKHLAFETLSLNLTVSEKPIIKKIKRQRTITMPSQLQMTSPQPLLSQQFLSFLQQRIFGNIIVASPNPIPPRNKRITGK